VDSACRTTTNGPERPRPSAPVSGASAPRKTVCVQGLALADVAKALDLA